MNALFVVNRASDWPFELPGVTVVSARAYLGEPTYATLEDTRVFNLCNIDRYQGRGYYVSLVAEARGHSPAPDVKTIEDGLADDPAVVAPNGGFASGSWPIDRSDADRIEIDCLFGRDPSGRHAALCERLYTLLRAPLVRASFEQRDGAWVLTRLRLLGAGQLSDEERAFAAEAARERLAPVKARSSSSERPALAVLFNEDESDPPSNPAALARLAEVGDAMGMRVEFVHRGEIDRLAEFDALFIRDTTHVNHYTYQFARAAAALGLVVIDDPDSILKCSNKVFLNELMARHRVPVPKTLVVQRGNAREIVATLGLPCIVKQPDSAFSRGVAKIETAAQLEPTLDELFRRSELVVAQEWLPTDFDWRVGVLDRRPLFACKYMMAPGHWQVVKRDRETKLEGATIAFSVGEAPSDVVAAAVKAANLIGDGLYGVDLKEVAGVPYVIEVNDNPNLDAGNEDAILGDALYREIIGVFMRRIRERAHGRV